MISQCIELTLYQAIQEAADRPYHPRKPLARRDHVPISIYLVADPDYLVVPTNPKITLCPAAVYLYDTEVVIADYTTCRREILDLSDPLLLTKVADRVRAIIGRLIAE